MHAVILAGGRGSRLRPFTFTIPKPLVPIGDIPIIELLIRQLAADGFARVTISVGHLAALIRSFCGTGEQWGVPIDYVLEDEPLGTAGSLSLIDEFDDDRVLVVNGDTLTDMDFAAAYREHSTEDGATICANTRTVRVDFGVLTTEAGYLAGYSEKPTLEYLVSMGTNVLTVEAMKPILTPGRHLDMPELFAELRRAGRRVRVRDDGSYWLDLGRIDDLEEGSRIFSENPNRFLRP